jgi:predicted  nucleic acid-binding Zn-ribbon protein
MSLEMKCDKCNDSPDNGVEVYCDGCYAELVQERDDLKAEVESLKDELASEKKEYRALENELSDVREQLDAKA